MRFLLLAALAALVPTAHAQGVLVTNDPSLCLAASGQNVTTRACSASLNVWQARYYPRNAFVIKAGSACLDAYRGSRQPVALVGCDGTLEQDWFLNRTGQIQNKRYQNLCLDIEGGVGAGRRVLAYDCDFNGNESARRANQRFYFGAVRPQQSGDRPTPVPGVAGSPFAGVGLQGAPVVASGGANVIAAGGGNVVASGGANVVAPGGAN